MVASLVLHGRQWLIPTCCRQASGVLFGPEAGNYENIIFRILGLGFLTAGTINWTQEVTDQSMSLVSGLHLSHHRSSQSTAGPQVLAQVSCEQCSSRWGRRS